MAEKKIEKNGTPPMKLQKQLAFRTKGVEKLARQILDISAIMHVEVSKILRLATEAGLPNAIQKLEDEQQKRTKEQKVQADEARRKLLE